MKTALFLSLFGSFSLFGDMITLDNQTPYPLPSTNTIIELQWASSSQEMAEKTIDSLYQIDRTQNATPLSAGKNQLDIPNSQKYFRVLVWEKGEITPTYVTSWVLIIPDKTYTVEEKDLYLSVLSAGSGC